MHPSSPSPPATDTTPSPPSTRNSPSARKTSAWPRTGNQSQHSTRSTRELVKLAILTSGLTRSAFHPYPPSYQSLRCPLPLSSGRKAIRLRAVTPQGAGSRGAYLLHKLLASGGLGFPASSSFKIQGGPERSEGQDKGLSLAAGDARRRTSFYV